MTFPAMAVEFPSPGARLSRTRCREVIAEARDSAGLAWLGYGNYGLRLTPFELAERLKVPRRLKEKINVADLAARLVPQPALFAAG